MQNLVWYLSLALMAIVAAIFGIVCLHAADKQPVDNPYRGRAALFVGALGVVLVVSLNTLLPWPVAAYAKHTAPPAKIIDAVGYQWRWELSDTTVPVGQPVEFRVTSRDVNHGFGVYRGKTRMLGQAQAMPGYVNRLRLTFDEPGEYEVLCMEYCGVAHHTMPVTITAVAE